MICGQNNSEFAQIARILTVGSAEASFFALSAPLRCPIPPSLRGVLGKIVVTFFYERHYGDHEETREEPGKAGYRIKSSQKSGLNTPENVSSGRRRSSTKFGHMRSSAAV
jgi:hypothetical protein